MTCPCAASVVAAETPLVTIERDRLDIPSTWCVVACELGCDESWSVDTRDFTPPLTVSDVHDLLTGLLLAHEAEHAATSQTPHDTEAPGDTVASGHSEHASVREGSNPRGAPTDRTEQRTRGFVQCSEATGCGGRWEFGPASRDVAFTFPSELDARLWADTHLTVCDGPIEVVVTHRDGEPV